MEHNIKAILFDIGGTLLKKENNGHRDLAVIQEMVNFLETPDSAEVLCEKLSSGEAAYKSWRGNTDRELSHPERWSRFYLPGYPQEFVQQNASQLQTWWSLSRGKRWVDKAAIETLQELSKRGYILGSVSHTNPKFLQDSGLLDLFHTVIYAADFGMRKPHPAIFLAAAHECGLAPQACAYIGDRPSRDVIGAREAGLGMLITISQNGSTPDGQPCPMQADAHIHDIRDLLALFPGISCQKTSAPPESEASPLFDIALSTSAWDQDMDNADAFFSRGRQLGFARFELNHQLPLPVFQSIDFNRYRIITLHNPCPAVENMKELEKQDRLLTSLAEPKRRSAVEVLVKTIEHAYRLGAKSVVVHCGQVAGDDSLDGQLRQLYRQGLKGSPVYEQMRETIIDDRHERGKPHLESLIRSLHEVVPIARDAGIRLGLENLFHIYELPTFEEMKILLEEFQTPWVGWQLDLGHLQVLSELGVLPYQDWLDHFSPRMIGVHFHDVIGIDDHQAPGCGDIDFQHIARYIPQDAHLTLEVAKTLTPQEIHAGLLHLENKACIKRL